MKTKRYELTEVKVLALKMATEEFYHQMKSVKTASPIILSMKNSLHALKDQFSNDYRLWKE